MNLLPFNGICAACGAMGGKLRYCIDMCEPNGTTFEPIRHVNSLDQPHLHRRCEQCGHEWLERCYGIIRSIPLTDDEKLI